MTHDEFLIALRDAATWAGPGSMPRPMLDAEAAAHARDCADCGCVLEALSLAACEDASLPDAVPPGYWDNFGARVMARLPPDAPSRTRLASNRLWMRIAAGLVVGSLALIAWRSSPPTRGLESDVDVASDSEFLARMAPEDVEDALASFSVSGFEAPAPEPAPGSVFAIDPTATDPIAPEGSSGSDFPDDARGPVERLESELLENLSESDQRELARRLHEASS